MSQKTLRNFIATGLVILFFITKHTAFLWMILPLFLFIGKRGKRVTPKTQYQELLFQVGADAKRFGLSMPSSYKLRKDLVRIYRRFELSKNQYPLLASEFNQAIDEMWHSLSANQSPSHWNHIVHEVLQQWPKQQAKSENSLQDQLKKLGELSRQWDDAKREAAGRAGVGGELG